MKVSDNVGSLHFLIYKRAAKGMDQQVLTSAFGKSPGKEGEQDQIMKRMIGYAKLAQAEQGGDNIFTNSVIFNQVARLVQNDMQKPLLALMDGSADKDDAAGAGATGEITDEQLSDILNSAYLELATTA